MKGFVLIDDPTYARYITKKAAGKGFLAQFFKDPSAHFDRPGFCSKSQRNDPTGAFIRLSAYVSHERNDAPIPGPHNQIEKTC